MIDNMLTLLQANSHVYVDVAGLIWSYPLVEVNRYIQRLVEAGFEDRVMFGTDQLQWPKLMAYSIGIIQNADYLSPEQKRDILYNNAARFLRLPPPQPNSGDAPHRDFEMWDSALETDDPEVPRSSPLLA